MIVLKTEWISHQGFAINSIDIHPDGSRVATAGADQKVRIWNMEPIRSSVAENDASIFKLLATLCDHSASVSTVRWSHSGRLLSSGSDDRHVFIYELKEGAAAQQPVFGSGEQASVENWKAVLNLRGHEKDVCDQAWAPDDSFLATCSLDNTVRIWNPATGACVTILNGHGSFVKGVSWDPVGSFLASQSDDKSVIVWSTADWSMESKIVGHFEKSVGATYFRRLDWSPCGSFLTATSSYQSPRHVAAVIRRGSWDKDFDYVGHKAPVVAVRYNPCLFWKGTPNDATAADGTLSTPKTPRNGAAGNGVETEMNGAETPSKQLSAKIAYNCLAVGGQDFRVSVWSSHRPEAVMVGKHLFSQSVVDFAWSPDGYTLLCCSADGSVAAFLFSVAELGTALSNTQLEELKRLRYGDTHARNMAIAESADQLMLEQALLKKSEMSGRHGSDAVARPTSASVGGAKPKAVAVTPVAGFHSPNPPGAVAGAEVAAAGGPRPTNGSVQAREGEESLRTASASVPLGPPPAQQEYRRADGKRRIIPVPLSQPSTSAPFPGSQSRPPPPRQAPEPAVASTAAQQGSPKRPKLGPSPAVPGQRQPLSTAQHSIPGPTNDGLGPAEMAGRVGVGGEAVLRGGGERVAGDGGFTEADAWWSGDLVQAPGLLKPHGKGGALTALVAAEGGTDELPFVLEAREGRGRGGEAGVAAEVVCLRGGEVQWRSCLEARAVAMAGNANMWAVGLQDGSLQVFTRSGRRMLPRIMLGSQPAFLHCDATWQLMALTCGGMLYIWDMRKGECVLKESAAPVLANHARATGPVAVVSARLSRAGAPLLVLPNHSAFVYDSRMRAWQSVADAAFPASEFVSSLLLVGASAQAGELEGLRRKAEAPKLTLSTEVEKAHTKAHLESLMAASLTLMSASEYRRWLVAYVRHLAKEGDACRLREVCEGLLGPFHPPQPPRSKKDATAAAAGTVAKWEPSVLGMDKRELLRKDVLPAMASSRAVQRLLNEFLDLLKDIDNKTKDKLNDKGR